MFDTNKIPFGCSHQFRGLCDAIAQESRCWDEKEKLSKEYNLAHEFRAKFEMSVIPHYLTQKGEEFDAFTSLWEESKGNTGPRRAKAARS